jgi:hypothetical protein
MPSLIGSAPFGKQWTRWGVVIRCGFRSRARRDKSTTSHWLANSRSDCATHQNRRILRIDIPTNFGVRGKRQRHQAISSEQSKEVFLSQTSGTVERSVIRESLSEHARRSAQLSTLLRYTSIYRVLVDVGPASTSLARTVSASLVAAWGTRR